MHTDMAIHVMLTLGGHTEHILRLEKPYFSLYSGTTFVFVSKTIPYYIDKIMAFHLERPGKCCPNPSITQI